ncbi:MAG: DUF1826 domain-containing protein [Gammaproteobacteria bacterium]
MKPACYFAWMLDLTSPSAASIRTAAPTSSHTYQADRLVDLVAIFEPEVQVCYWPRPCNLQIARYLMTFEPNRTSGFRQVVRSGKPVSPLSMPNLPGYDTLTSDLDFLIGVYSELLGCPAVGLRFERLNRAMCPGFHVDRLGIRLICTYHGPGTQWLGDQSIDRHQLRDIDITTTAIEEAPTFALVLLKGTLWQGNGHRGAIHRSPTVPAGIGHRVLATMDALWSS